MQRKWGRKYIGGAFYYIYPMGLQMGNFWSDKEITSCQSKTLNVEIYNVQPGDDVQCGVGKNNI